MKKLYLIVCLLVAAMAANAQFDSTYTVIDSSQTGTVQKWLSVFQHIPTDSAHSGFFIDRTPWLQHPSQFTGRRTNAEGVEVPDTTYFETLANLHFGLKRSQVDSSDQTLFDSTEHLLTTAIALATDSTLPIGMMHLRYHTLGIQAFADTLLYYDEVDSCFKPTDGKYDTPFEEKELFAAAPMVSELYAGNYRLLLPDALILSNTNDTIVQVQFRLGSEGEFITLHKNTPFDVQWMGLEGQHFLHLAFLLGNGKWYFTVSPVFFKTRPAPYTELYSNAGTVVNFAAVPGQHAGATVTVRYGCGKNKLTKPLIIVEGFDPPEVDEFNFNNILVLFDNDQIRDRVQELESQGYDLVYIDHKNGSDSLERNIRLFKEVVAWCNAQKATNGSTEKNAVLGISMGGLIARMGLREMELQNTPHQTDVYISLDAPHRGAYVPLSFQFMLADAKKLADENLIFRMSGRDLAPGAIKPKFDTLDKAIAVAQSPAAKQLQFNNIFDQYYDCSILPCLNIVSPAYKAFHHKYDSIGPPQLTSNYAIVSGSIDGQRQHDKNGMMIPDGAFYASHQKTWFNMNLSVSIDYVCPRGFGFTSNAESEFILNAQHNVPNQLIYKSNVRFKLTYHRCAYVIDLIDIHPIRRWVNSTPSTRARDNAPGGYLSTDEYKSISNDLVKAGIDFVDNIPDKFTFVPTYSALDINTTDIYFNFDQPTNTSKILVDPARNVFLYFPSNNVTSFDVISAPNKSSQDRRLWNESHAKPSIHSGASLFAALMGTVSIFISDSVDDYIHSMNYNYGKITQPSGQTYTTSTFIYDDIFVTNGKSLLINGNAPLGFANSMFPAPDVQSVFTLSTRGKVCNLRTNITVDNSSSLILGSQTDSRSGILEVLDNSTVRLMPNSYLELNNNSTIKLKWGSKLVVEPFANINLANSNSTIEFEPNSTLEFVNGASLTFTGDGYLLFRGSSMQDQVKFVGVGGSIQLSGSGKNDKVVEFKRYDANNKYFMVPLELDFFNIQNGFIQSDCELIFNANTNLDYCKIENTSSTEFNSTLISQHTDVVSPNTYLHGNTVITGGSFKGNCIATNIFNNNDELYMNGTVFKQLEGNGLSVYNSRNTLSNLVFVSQHQPMEFQAMSFPTVLDGVLIHNHPNFGMPNSGGNGIFYEGASNGSTLHLKRTNVLQQSANALWVDNAQVSLECSQVIGNRFTTTHYSTILTNGASLVLDPSIVPGAGKSDLSGYRNTILFSNALNAQLNNGLSNLSSPLDAFVGNLTTEYLPGVDQFIASNNYWKFGAAPTRTDHYWHFTDGASRQFGINGNVSVDAAPFLTSPPVLSSLCPQQAPGGGGGGQAKQSEYKMDHVGLLNISDEELSLNNSYATLINQVFDPTLTIATDARIQSGLTLIEATTKSDNPDVAVAELLIYQKVLSHIGSLITDNTIQFGKASEHLLALEHIQQQMLKRNTLSTEMQFKLEMDKVFTHRMGGQLLMAQSDIIKLKSQYPEKHDYLNKWECTIQNEIDLDNGVIGLVAFRQRVSSCTSIDKAALANRYTNQKDKEAAQKSTNNNSAFIYPNPAISEIYVSNINKGSEAINLRVVDLVGRTVLVKTLLINDNETKLNISELTPGLYHIVSDCNRVNQKFTVVK